jgi:hypothetical protein
LKIFIDPGDALIMPQIKCDRKISLIFLLFLLIIFSPCTNLEESKTPRDIKGWGKAQWGMSEKEILKLFKDEGVYKKESSLVIDSFEIEGYEFQVIFIMDPKGKKLKMVLISTPFLRPIHPKDQFLSEELFKRIERGLIGKYGPPTQKKEKKEPDEEKKTDVGPSPNGEIHTFFDFKKGNIGFESIWNFPNTEIILSYIENYWPHTKIIIFRPDGKTITLDERWDKRFDPITHTLTITYRDSKKLRDKI